MNKSRRKLSDILDGGDSGFRANWNSTAAASDDAPIPRGEYVCHALTGELFNAKTRTPGYKISFEVIEGEHASRRVWHDLWLTDAALPRTKRDLVKLGITTAEQMEQPLPEGIRCRVTVVLRKDDDGIERNEVRRFEVLGIDERPENPFAPDEDTTTGTDDPEIPV